MLGSKSHNNPSVGCHPRQSPSTGGTRIVSAPIIPEDASNDGGNPAFRATDIRLQARPLAGALFSASADGLGELFPLYIGRNTIGNNPDCDIYLPEATVGVNHAVILIRAIPDADGLIRMSASITDYDSEFGTVVDNQPAGFDKIILRGGECIRIGHGYILLLQLFDSSIPGWGRNPAFRPAERVRDASPGANWDLSATEEEVYPNAVGEKDEFSFYGRPPGKPLSPSRRPVNEDKEERPKNADKSGFYGDATRRNPEAAPGTILNR